MRAWPYIVGGVVVLGVSVVAFARGGRNDTTSQLVGGWRVTTVIKKQSAGPHWCVDAHATPATPTRLYQDRILGGCTYYDRADAEHAAELFYAALAKDPPRSDP